MKALAVDLGGTHVSYGVVEDQSLVFYETFDVVGATTLRAVLASLEDVLRWCQTTYGECAGLAMGLPCIVDTSTNHVLSALRKYEDATDINLSEWCRDRLGLDLRIENDARMALLGEQHAGAGRGEEDLVMMTLGTGIGTAALIHGRLLRGTHFHAACLGGHLTVNLNGRLCQCGNVAARNLRRQVGRCLPLRHGGLNWKAVPLQKFRRSASPTCSHTRRGEIRWPSRYAIIA